MTTPAPLPPEQQKTSVPFEFRDVVRHSWTVLAVFMVCVVGYALYLGVADLVLFGRSDGLLYALTITGVVGFSALLLVWIGAPFAWLLGVALRRIASTTVHVLAFGALGVAAGAFVATGLVSGPVSQEPWFVIVIMALISGVCTALGRYVAFRSRRRTAAAEGVGSDAG